MAKFIVTLTREVFSTEYQKHWVIVETNTEDDAIRLAQSKVYDGEYEVDEDAWEYVDSQETNAGDAEVVHARPLDDDDEEDDFEVMSS